MCSVPAHLFDMEIEAEDLLTPLAVCDTLSTHAGNIIADSLVLSDLVFFEVVHIHPAGRVVHASSARALDYSCISIRSYTTSAEHTSEVPLDLEHVQARSFSLRPWCTPYLHVLRGAFVFRRTVRELNRAWSAAANPFFET